MKGASQALQVHGGANHELLEMHFELPAITGTARPVFAHCHGQGAFNCGALLHLLGKGCGFLFFAPGLQKRMVRVYFQGATGLPRRTLFSRETGVTLLAKANGGADVAIVLGTVIPGHRLAPLRTGAVFVSKSRIKSCC